jgi:heme-degrading monooxygenase HmoA
MNPRRGEEMRTVMLVDHRVADFDAWRKVYDEVRGWQHEHGVHFQQVLRNADDPNRVVVTHAFDSREAAEAFVNNPELQEAMGRGGVDASSVKVEYFDEVEMEDV